MKTTCFFALVILVTIAATEESPAAPARQEQVQPAQKAPREVGKPQTREEYDAYIAMTQAQDPRQQVELCEKYLNDFPDSGLTSYVHQIAATAYQQLNNFDKLVEHGEATLKELPESPVVLTMLVNAYAERGKPDLALERADQAVSVISNLQVPAQTDPAQFAREKQNLLATVYSSKGLAHLVKAQEARDAAAAEAKQQPPGEGGIASEDAKKQEAHPDLQMAISNLNKALELNPKDNVVYFRLGIAHTLKNDVENAKSSYAKAIALGENETVVQMARDELKAILTAVLKVSQEEASESLEQRVAKAMEEAISKAGESLNAAAPEPSSQWTSSPN
ncbi:MAG: hypothetical protein HYX74_05040 [Acidobacteria bacterium]|nr:hypothetical protein [Acidobacteriota bacterium]